MKRVFGINSFRLCQEGVCNACMDGRDVVCIMPTGGGKSLTYQLPAIVNPGCTLVISPLISLITDQILHLREAGIEAVKLTGSTSKEEGRSIFSRLTSPSSGGQKDIKLCYVTPEKIAKSKAFTSMLEKMAAAGRLSRIVIDESHCVSQLGHDYRPDYKKLSILRQLLPHIPILTLSATCPEQVLKDMLKILRMKEVVDGTAASKDGTVLFTSPLYRKNLHYRVVPKPSSASGVIQAMSEYILENHRDRCGIVYCLSKKDTETVAIGLRETSGDKIKTGVYHADIPESEKERLHIRWRSGEVQVVCATIAFGMGIDKADVRFVLHHSKSPESYYQESGRAGRDGLDSDCVLYYRGQDATRLSSLICGEVGGQEKLHSMLKFAQDIQECRKVFFAKQAPSSSRRTSSTDETAFDPCGHCDNCTRSPESAVMKDVTTESWQLLQMVEEVAKHGGRVTVGMLADLARGVGGGFGVSTRGSKGGKGKSTEKMSLNLDEIAGGKLGLNKEDTETLIIQLVLLHHLQEEFHSTAYSINVYVSPGSQSARLTRLTKEDVAAGKGPRIECGFVKKAAKKKAKAKAAPSAATTKNASKPSSTSAKPGSAKGKRKALGSDEGSDGEEDFADQMNDISDASSAEDGGGDEENWSFTMGGSKRASATQNPPPKRIRSVRDSGTTTRGKTSAPRSTKPRDPDQDIIILSDDSDD
ncbi:hypothetical protein BOTBODRAFT_115767 [Botryobasidium botryosum FD-172 SS1]|uniref:ATP-dependent DNA helicase n=1 Tax=Botryobasidium botryosum (strain FD-172 SS1) TaxID=930990 RepID=A0A067MG16_BOTB1|nr:hypothetical protein BOTBODRAFT_115767 [Botryobasidium botryosum FD-172 SS1]